MPDPVSKSAKSIKPVESAKDHGRKAPDVVAPSNRITVALPFSQIKLSETSAELGSLADLVCDLVEALSSAIPEERLAPLRSRAEALRAQLH